MLVEASTSDFEKVVFNRFVHEHIAEKGKNVVRIRQYVCSECGRPFKDDEEVKDALEEDGEDAFVICTNRKCRAKIPLWDLTEQKFASDEFKQRVRALRELAQIEIDNQDREQILLGHAFAIAGEAGQIFRPTSYADVGIDGEIEFRDYQGNASGERVYLQLKSGDSYLRERQHDRTEIFDIKKPRWAEYWIQQKYPVMLVIRTSDKQIRWFNATKYLQEKKAAGDWPIRQIVFEAEDFSPLNLLRMRTELIGQHPGRVEIA